MLANVVFAATHAKFNRRAVAPEVQIWRSISICRFRHWRHFGASSVTDSETSDRTLSILIECLTCDETAVLHTKNIISADHDVFT